MNINFILVYLLCAAAYATFLYHVAPISMTKAVAVGLLSPLMLLVAFLQIMYSFLGTHVSLLVATHSDNTEIGPTERKRGDE